MNKNYVIWGKRNAIKKFLEMSENETQHTKLGNITNKVLRRTFIKLSFWEKLLYVTVAGLDLTM